MTIRLAKAKDLPAVASIYEAIHDEEEAGRTHTGWQRGVYPTEETARRSLQRNELYVLEENGQVLAAGRINREQVDVYATIPWAHQADEVLVLHTLVVHPAAKGKGCGKAFVRYYEELALAQGIHELRIDTNENNTAARGLYKALGWAERGIVPCVFNGIPGVGLVCLEKYMG